MGSIIDIVKNGVPDVTGEVYTTKDFKGFRPFGCFDPWYGGSCLETELFLRKQVHLGFMSGAMIMSGGSSFVWPSFHHDDSYVTDKNAKETIDKPKIDLCSCGGEWKWVNGALRCEQCWRVK